MPNEPIVSMLSAELRKKHKVNKPYLSKVTIADVDNLGRALLDRREAGDHTGLPSRVATCCCCMTCCCCAAAVVPNSNSSDQSAAT
jgi:hypothetical protein